MGLSKEEVIFKAGNELYAQMVMESLPGNLRILPYDVLLRNFEQQFFKNIFLLVPNQPVSGPIRLRSAPTALSDAQAQAMIVDKGFYDKYFNSTASGIAHQYRIMEIGKDKIVIDNATGLIWQQGGSSEWLTMDSAKSWIATLNQKRFAGYDEWRLPTLEELMSLMAAKETRELYIDEIFAGEQSWIWTSDQSSDRPGCWWVVLFDYGHCTHSYDVSSSNFVRAVRSGQSSAR